LTQKINHKTAPFESFRKTRRILPIFIFIVSDVHSSVKETTIENEGVICPAKVILLLNIVRLKAP